MKIVNTALMCLVFAVSAWAGGPTATVPVDLDLIGAIKNSNCDFGDCTAIKWGGTANRYYVETTMRVPQFWDGNEVALRFFIEAGLSPFFNEPEPDNEFEIAFEIDCGPPLGDQFIFIPYPVAEETVEVNLVLDDLAANGIQPGDACSFRFAPQGHSNWPGDQGYTYFGAAALYFDVVLPFTDGDCNWDGVVDASDMACLVNAVFN